MSKRFPEILLKWSIIILMAGLFRKGSGGLPLFLCLFFLSTAITLYGQGRETSQRLIPAESGLYLDLSQHSWDTPGVVDLSGKWLFSWRRWMDPRNPEVLDSTLVDQPGIWNSLPEEYPGQGFGSFYRQVRLPSEAVDHIWGLKITYMYTSYELYINGRLVARNGVIGKDRDESRPQYLPQVVFFTPRQQELDIVVHVSNFDHRKGGMPEPLVLGRAEDVLKVREGRIMAEMITVGILSIIGLYHLMIFLLRRKERSALFFSLYCFAIGFRTLLMGERIWYHLFPHFPWFLGQKLDYLTIYLSFPLLVYFLHLLYPANIKKVIPRITAALSLPFTLIVLVTPAPFFTQTLTYYFILIVVDCFFLVHGLIKAVVEKKAGARLLLGGGLLFFLTGLNDILYNNGLIATAYLSTTGLVFFTVTQTILLSYLFTRAYKLIEVINTSLWRFVPREFLQFLGKEDIVEIELGDQVHGKLTLLFSDIRGFTALSEKMSPEDNFNFINAFLHYTGPVIRKYGGFIDKYIGDAIMAIFPGESEKAVYAALEMQKAADRFNRENGKFPPVEIGIAINTGTIMLGIVGETERIESTVISDVVNVASRLEGLNKEFGSKISISGAVFQELKNDKIRTRPLGVRKVRGRAEPVEIYEVLGYRDEVPGGEKKGAES